MFRFVGSLLLCLMLGVCHKLQVKILLVLQIGGLSVLCLKNHPNFGASEEKRFFCKLMAFSACNLSFSLREKKNQMQETWENFCCVPMTTGDSSAPLESDNKIGSDRGILLKLPFL